MDRLVVRTSDALATIGAAEELEGTLTVPDFRVGGRDFHVEDGISYDLEATAISGAVLVTGETRARLSGQCDRCLGPAELDLVGEVDALFSEEGAALDEGSDVLDDGDGADDADFADEDGIYYGTIANDEMDLTDLVSSSIAIEIPFKVLCDPDCKGLCPRCGQNLNEGPCDCPERTDDDRNPFAVLRDLDLGGE